MRPLLDHGFVVFGPQDLIVLAVFAIGCLLAVLAGVRLRGRPRREAVALRVAGAAILVVCAPFELVDLVVGVHHPLTGLPLQICDFAWAIAGFALLTRSPRWCALLYYWGLTLCVQGVFTPDLDQAFPHLQFFGFWVRHIAPVWAAVYLVGAGRGPAWRGYRFGIVATAIWAAAVMSLNFVSGSDYGFLNGKPSTASVLNLLGPWPWYLLVEFTLVAGVWALITWQWNPRAPNADR